MLAVSELVNAILLINSVPLMRMPFSRSVPVHIPVHLEARFQVLT
jgi:hypothetical protein